MWIKKKGISLIIVIIGIFAIILFMFIEVLKQANNKAEMPSINQGTLDLSNWNQMQNGLISLNGEWEFYWEKILSNDEINDSYTNPDLLVSVPDVWNNYELNGKSLSGYGYATYRLKVKNAQEGKLISIRMPTVSTAYRLYFDDNLISSNGIVGEDVCHYTPEYQPKTLVFMPTNKDFNIILQIANFSYARGGAWYSITMGTVKAVENYDRIIIYKDMFLVGAFMIMAVFFLFLFIMYKEDKANLYFVLLCICALIRVGIYGDFSISRIIPMINYYTIVKMDYISIYWISTTYILLLGEIFSEHKSKKIHKIFVVYAVFMSIFTLVSPIIIFTTITYLIEGVTLVLFTYALAYSIMAFYIKISGGATAILIGSVTVLFASIHDVLYQNDYIHSEFGEFSTFATFVLVLIQAVLLAKRFRDSLNETQTAKLAFLQAQIKPHFLYKPIQIERFGKTIRRILKKNSQTINRSEQNNNVLNIKYLPEAVTSDSGYYIQIFGELSITKNGTPLSINWRSSKVRELFEFYVHNRYSKIHRQKILDELWGDMEYERALTNFNTCNYQLRKQFKDIGLDIYPVFSKGYYQLIIGDATCDAEVFDEILSSIDKVHENNLEMITKTLALYKGGYCQNATGLWAVSRRCDFENLFINTALLVAEYYFRNNMYSHCINYSQKIIEENQLVDKAWLLLLKALKMSGDVLAYNKAYENMKTIFLKELGTIPNFNC